MPIELGQYLAADGSAPFAEWLDDLRDGMARVRIAKRLTKLQVGLLGDWKAVGGGVMELREDYGPGYRVYCARHGSWRQTDTAKGHRTCTRLLARLEAAPSAVKLLLRARSASQIT